MMTSLLHWTKTLVITATTVLFSSFYGSLDALALSTQEVIQKLSLVPVFTIANQNGDVILIPNQQTQRNVLILFMSYQAAQDKVEEFQQKNPQQSYQVLPVSLASMYQFVKSKQGQQNPPLLELVPIPKQVDAAISLLRQQSQTSNFKGVPIFYATLGDNQAETFLTATSGNQTFIPLYLEREAAQNQIQALIQKEPDLTSALKMRVMSLEQLIGILESRDNQAIRQMIIVTPQESVQFIPKIQQ
jgi:hypothetical protein